MGTKIIYGYWLLIFLLNFANAGTWETHKQNLPNLAGEITALEHELASLIATKRTQTDRTLIQKSMKEISEKYKKLEETYKKYNKEVTHVKFRHPEQGEEGERQYTLIKPKTVEQIESDIGVDGKLDRIKRKMERQYQKPVVETPPEQHVEDKNNVDEESKTKRILLKK